jgi:hypothetical protein
MCAVGVCAATSQPDWVTQQTPQLLRQLLLPACMLCASREQAANNKHCNIQTSSNAVLATGQLALTQSSRQGTHSSHVEDTTTYVVLP